MASMPPPTSRVSSGMPNWTSATSREVSPPVSSAARPASVGPGSPSGVPTSTRKASASAEPMRSASAISRATNSSGYRMRRRGSVMMVVMTGHAAP